MAQQKFFTAESKKSGVVYYLHMRMAANNKTPLFFFAKEPKEGALAQMPEGYEIGENPTTGLPVLKRKQLVAA